MRLLPDFSSCNGQRGFLGRLSHKSPLRGNPGKVGRVRSRARARAPACGRGLVPRRPAQRKARRGGPASQSYRPVPNIVCPFRPPAGRALTSSTATRMAAYWTWRRLRSSCRQTARRLVVVGVTEPPQGFVAVGVMELAAFRFSQDQGKVPTAVSDTDENLSCALRRSRHAIRHQRGVPPRLDQILSFPQPFRRRRALSAFVCD